MNTSLHEFQRSKENRTRFDESQETTERGMFTCVSFLFEASIDSHSEYKTDTASAQRSVLFEESKKKTTVYMYTS